MPKCVIKKKNCVYLGLENRDDLYSSDDDKRAAITAFVLLFIYLFFICLCGVCLFAGVFCFVCLFVCSSVLISIFLLPLLLVL